MRGLDGPRNMCSPGHERERNRGEEHEAAARGARPVAGVLCRRGGHRPDLCESAGAQAGKSDRHGAGEDRQRAAGRDRRAVRRSWAGRREAAVIAGGAQKEGVECELGAIVAQRRTVPPVQPGRITSTGHRHRPIAESHGVKNGRLSHLVGIGWEAISALPREGRAPPENSLPINEVGGAPGRTRTSNPQIRSLYFSQLFQ